MTKIPLKKKWVNVGGCDMTREKPILTKGKYKVYYDSFCGRGWVGDKFKDFYKYRVSAPTWGSLIEISQNPEQAIAFYKEYEKERKRERKLKKVF